MKRKLRSIICILLTSVMLCGLVLDVWATTIKELQEDIRKKQEQLNNISTQVEGLESEQEVLEEEIQDLDSELINLYTQIGVLEEQISEKEGQITDKQAEIEVAQAEYEEAAAEEARQYAAMKLRIRYMYETGNESYYELLISSHSISDMLNKAEYIENLYEYDRKMLENFQEIKEQVAEMKASLEEDKRILEEEMASLEADKAELAEQQSYLNGVLAQKKAESANYEAEIAAAQAQAAAYKKQIAADNKKIAQLQEEERRKLAAKNGTGKTYTPNANAAATVASAQAVVANSAGSATGKQLANYGCQFIGNPYVPGGTSLTSGADCSGFIFRIYADFGYRVPRTSYALRAVGTGVSLGEAQPGDIVCYEGHVGMYIGGGLIVHASTQRTGIKVSNAQYRPILTIRRVV